MTLAACAMANPAVRRRAPVVRAPRARAVTFPHAAPRHSLAALHGALQRHDLLRDHGKHRDVDPIEHVEARPGARARDELLTGAYFLSERRRTNLGPDQSSSTAQTCTSTKPEARAPPFIRPSEPKLSGAAP